uniref:Putative secreted protein n=1 Tax=Anopheles darlingi TaxID=43151 RepID=A0A2M4D1P1_ANODA
MQIGGRRCIILLFIIIITISAGSGLSSISPHLQEGGKAIVSRFSTSASDRDHGGRKWGRGNNNNGPHFLQSPNGLDRKASEKDGGLLVCTNRGCSGARVKGIGASAANRIGHFVAPPPPRSNGVKQRAERPFSLAGKGIERRAVCYRMRPLVGSSGC